MYLIFLYSTKKQTIAALNLLEKKLNFQKPSFVSFLYLIFFKL